MKKEENIDDIKLANGEFISGEYLGYEWLVARQEMGHLCGYVRLWDGHPLEILWKTEKYPYEAIDIRCHGGLTFGEKIGKKSNVRGFTPGYWIGWDYAHVGDEMIINYPTYHSRIDGKHWKESEVIKECYDVIGQLVEKYPKPNK